MNGDGKELQENQTSAVSMLDTWTPTLSIPATFAKVVEAMPVDHLAYVGADGRFTYAELDCQSNQLANILLEMIGSAEGGKQKVVVLLLPHAAVSIVGILGVLKAGHLCVPLAPEHGSQHHRLVAEDCRPAAVVTIQSLLQLAQAMASPEIPILAIDTLSAAVSSDSPCVEISPQTYALLLYTSGSTGQPRGVIRSHAQTTTYAVYQADDLNLTHTSRVAHLNSYAMAGSAMMLYGALLNGATLYAYPLQEATFSALYEFLSNHQITTMSSLVSTLRRLAELTDTYPPLASMRAVVTGGETIHAQDVTSIMRILPPGCQLICSLSSTETSTFARLFVEVGMPWEKERVPAGYPPPYIALMILDDDKQPLPPGIEGEIAVRSRYITPGYWHQPTLNAAKFLPDPDGGDRRILLTGDRGCINADGMLEHRGRMDFMIKVRGYRVEPESIESALLKHPNVFECVVVACPSRSGDNQLVAYLAAKGPAAPSVPELRDLLAKALPSYMIPSRFVFLDKLPRNANHKVDRSALPSPGRNRPDVATVFVAPRTEQEQRIADIWAEFLDLDEVGVDDNFFELGGDSLLAMRMALAVEQVNDGQVPTDDAWSAFFRTPTVRQLVHGLTDNSRLSTSDGLSLAALSTQQPQPSGPTSTWSTSTWSTLKTLLHKARRLGQWGIQGTQFVYHVAASIGLGLAVYRGSARLLFWLCGQSWFQHRQQDEADLIRNVLNDAAWPGTDPERVVQHGLMLSLLKRVWGGSLDRLKQSDFAQVCSVKGAEHLTAMQKAGRGVLCLHHHAVFARAFWAWLDLEKIPIGAEIFPKSWKGSNDSEKIATNVQQLRIADGALRKAGLVNIMADGYKGGRSLVLPFLAKERSFQTGFAELGQSTGAAVVPVTVVVDKMGQVQITISPPFEYQPDQTDNTHHRRLVQQYVTHLEQHWQTNLANIGRYHLDTYLKRNKATNQS